MSENATDITNDNIQDNNGNDSLLTGGSLYESSTDKYKDNLSSAITFFVCGGIGIILMILNDIGIIKIVTKDAPSFLFINIVLGLLFIGFIAIGVWSLKYSNKIKAKAETEDKKAADVLNWLEDNITKEDIENSYTGDIQEEIQLEEPVIEEQPTAEAVAVAEVPETDANETGQPETEPELIATEEPEAEELPEVKIEPKPESVSEEAPEEEPVEESSETVLEPDFSPVTEEPAKEQSEETIIEEQKPETETTEEEEEKTVITEKAEVTAEQIIAQELHKANMEPVTPQEQPEIEQPKATYTDKDSDKKEKSAIPYLIATIIIVLLLCGGAILFIYYPDLFSSSSDKNVVDIPEVTQPVQPEAQLSDTIAHKDTVVEAVQPQPVVKKEPTAEPVKAESKPAQQQPTASAYSDSASYKITGTKTKYTIKEGETLTKVSLRFYGTKAMWPYIVKHNPKVIKNPDNVPYGTTIEIPELTKE